eukprot:6202101-Pleurochrysis_carterae.AAC.2
MKQWNSHTRRNLAGHPILRLFTRPKEMKNGLYMCMSKEDIGHMNGADGKKLTHDTLQDGNSEVIGDYIWSVAKPGIGGDTRKQKEGGDGTSRKVRGSARSNGQNESSGTGSSTWPVGGLSHSGGSGVVRNICYTKKCASATSPGLPVRTKCNREGMETEKEYL